MTQDLLQDPDSARVVKQLPTYVVTALCWLFAILFGIWALPHTVFIRHTSMALGAALGLYVIGYLWKNSLLKMQANVAPIFLILALFVWVTIHLLWIGQQPELQWLEYTRIWKKILICFPFALGLGLGIRYVIENGNKNQSKKLWRIIYFGLCLPTLIFFVKFSLTKWANAQHIELSPYFILSEDWSFASGMPKYFYVFFSLPAFAIALGSITQAIIQNDLKLKTHSLYFLVLASTPVIFYLVLNRNGMLYAGILVFLALIMLVLSSSIKRPIKLGAVLTFLIFFCVMATASYQVNPAWRMFIADLKMAIQLDEIDNWKYQGQAGVPYPLNGYGVSVSPSNYERFTWGLAGMRFVSEDPLGYGLMTLSFDHLTKAKWPNSFMSQTHSAWLDFTLGYGIPGVALLVAALLLAWRNSRFLKGPWSLVGRWGLGVLGLIMGTTELSSEIFINALIFMVVMVAGLAVSAKSNKQPIKLAQ